MELESFDQQSSPAKRSAGIDKSLTEAQSQVEPRTVVSQSISVTSELSQPMRSGSNSPMLLNSELIDKLMSNRTLVNLMSNQLKRVIDTERMSDDDKQRIVRQVFDQMMEEKVDFSMNNVRLAVKTVSSSYRAAVEKQRKKSSTTSIANAKRAAGSRSSGQLSSANKIDLKGFGRRSNPASPIASSLSSSSSSSFSTSTSKSFPVIDTALKLTKQDESSRKATKRKSLSTMASVGSDGQQASASPKLDSSGNPIVVVLLPQEKA